MRTIPPEYQPVVARFAERLAKLRPEMRPHLNNDTAEVNDLFSFPRDPHRQDAALDDITAINLKIQQQD